MPPCAHDVVHVVLMRSEVEVIGPDAALIDTYVRLVKNHCPVGYGPDVQLVAEPMSEASIAKLRVTV